MNRMEFMKILGQKLADISESEREEALQYYEDYLNDAGIENEQEALEELGSPEHLADTIKAGLNGGGMGEYTEHGYQSSQAQRNSAAPYENAAQHSGNPYEGGAYAQQNSKDASWQQSGSRTGDHAAGQPVKNGASASKIILIVILCILFSPVILPLAGALIAAAVGLLLGIFGIWVGLLVAGIALFIAGLVGLVAGVVKMLAFPAAGAVLLGIGFLCFGIGLLLTAFMVWMFAKLVPPFCRWLAGLCRKPFERKEGAV